VRFVPRALGPRLRRPVAILLLAAAGGWPGPAAGDSPLSLQPVTTGLTRPVYVTSARDGTGRLFIVEAAGVIRVLQPGATVPTVFLDISSRVGSGGERGLLGLAFHPSFAVNGRFFVNYTRKSDGATVIAEHRVSGGNPNVASTERKRILQVAQPFENHNGGMLAFGPDDFLYIGMGDGGSAYDPDDRAQNPDDLLGKILRIDVDRRTPGQRYVAPPDNPFVGIPGRDEVFALGFRNPYRFSFDRVTGALYVGDVGHKKREEVAIVALGQNHGWRVWEGTRCTMQDPCDATGFTFPVIEYGHRNGRCSVIGGYAYRGPLGTLAPGAYVYADYCSGELFVLEAGVTRVGLLAPDLSPASFGEDEAGEIYVVDLAGAVYRLVAGASPPPPPP